VSGFRVYRSLTEIERDAPPAALSIGNFDGLHAGHHQLLARNLRLARERGLMPSVLTFDPHPTTIVAPERAPKLLTTIDERIDLMRRTGIQQVFVLTFDRAFSELTPEQFVRDIVVDAIRARVVLVGDNFRFGHGHAGDVHTLRSLGQQYGFEVEIVTAIKVRGRMVSSSAVRTLIEQGDVSRVARLLLRPYALEGHVVSGFGIGSKQTVPTLNLDTKAEVLPARGVYVTRTLDLDDGRSWPSITNIGTRPTFDGEHQTIETFLLAPLEGKSPERIRVLFLRRVRDERRFDSPEALKAQILRDAARAAAFHRRTQGLQIAL
jgi:riboflavin kinase/FMN adenylyltransferase